MTQSSTGSCLILPVPVVGLRLAVRPVVAGRVGVALPVLGHGAPVGHAGPAADGQGAVLGREGQAQAGQVAVAPLERLDPLQAVGPPRRLVAGPVEAVLRLHPDAALCQAVHLGRLVPLLLHADGGRAQRPVGARFLGAADGLGRLAAAEQRLVGLLQRLRAAEGLGGGGGGAPVAFAGLAGAAVSESWCQERGGVGGRRQARGP